MSVLNPVLYGNRLYSQETYAWNADPQTFNLSFSETVSEADVIGNDVTKPLSDAMSLLDAFITTLQLVKTDTMTLADAKAISMTKPLSDTVTPTDAAIRTLTKALSDTMALSDSTSKTVSKPLSDSMTLSEAFMVSFGRAFADTVTLADSIAKTAKISVSDVQALSDTVAHTIHKALSETITSTDSKALIISRVLSEFVNVMDAGIVLTITKGLNEILLVQDWISIRIEKPQLWTTGAKPLVAYSSLYGRPLYGVEIYSGLFATVWISIKPTQPSVNGWRNLNQLETDD
jgi:hypothetical protein